MSAFANCGRAFAHVLSISSSARESSVGVISRVKSPLLLGFDWRASPSVPFGDTSRNTWWRSSQFYRKSSSAKGMRAMLQERPARIERRLSAILAADVAGYSRIMHNDEETTHTV